MNFSKVDKLTKEVCMACGAKCCNNIAIEIEEPSNAEYREYIRWYLAHKNVSVFVEDGSWYIEFHTECKELLPDKTCGIYENRPKMCKDYGYDDDEDINCFISKYPFNYEHEFRSLEEFDAYITERNRKRFKKYKKRKPRKKKATEK